MLYILLAAGSHFWAGDWILDWELGRFTCFITGLKGSSGSSAAAGSGVHQWTGAQRSGGAA